MVAGTISGNQAIVPLSVRSQQGEYVEFEFVLDTGFAGFLTLPPAAVALHGFPWINRIYVRLAGDLQMLVDVHGAIVLFGGDEAVVDVLALDGDALLGMSTMRGSEVRMEVEEGGSVEIVPL